MNISTILVLIVGVAELILGIYILAKNPRDEIRRAYSYFTFSVAVWVIANIPQQFISEKFTDFYAGRVTYVAAAFIASTFLYFVWVFPYKTVVMNVWRKILIFVVPLFFAFTALFTHWLTIRAGFDLNNNANLELGPLYNFFVLYFLGYWIWALSLLVTKYQKSDGVHRQQLKYLLWGIILSSIGGTTTNLFMPWWGIYNYGWIGPLSSVIWFGFTYYVIFGRE